MLALDYTFMREPAVAGAITEAAWKSAAAPFRQARAATMDRYARGELGFFDLPRDVGLLASGIEAAKQAHARGVTDVVVLGIGGSALGPIALRTALRPSGWNTLSETARGGLPRLHVLDNVDPGTMAALLERLDPRTVLVVVISKSGGTAETMAQYLVARAWLEAAGAPPRDHLVFVTDPERGALRKLANQEGIPSLAIPPNVGGRFSVLSPVGILPALLMGIDARALLDGADEMRQRCDTDDLGRNPAGVFAVLQWLSDRRQGRGTHVFMPYADQLRDLAAWFVQLWAESLGKIAGDGTHVGPTPVAALGATDQHSQVQLFMEGPADKTVTFVVVREGGVDLPIPNTHADLPDLAYLGGHTLGELLRAEQQATAAALAARGRPSMTITLDRCDAWHLGGLFMLLEIATAYAGELYGVNAFDQPGVELGKRFTYALFGRPGFADARQEWEGLPRSDPRYIV
ncbi:MAG TPA: glucose-6-phosphate isomerase [Gemmatimonadaceae bacterium]